MARASLLNTKTQTFLELIGNGKRYRVPPYQRDYSWGKEQWEDLWNDIVDLLGKPDEHHYMGALVVEAIDDREFKIIDGQQRLATLSILALAVISHLHRLVARGLNAAADHERALGLRSRFIGEKDPASLIEASKLSLNETDDAFYQDYLVQLRRPLNPRALAQSNKLLWECFEWFSQRVGELPFEADGQKLASMLHDTVARQLLFIQITVDDELNAYTVFETLNARGLELTVTDLLKNYFFSRVNVRADLDALQRRWRALIATVRQERFPDFLRYHLLCEIPKVRTARLFKLVRDRVKSAPDVFALMDVLRDRSEVFAAINDPSHEYWIEHPECRTPVRELNLFRAKQMTPLVMTAWDKLSKPEFARLLKVLAVITFRYTVVSGLNTNELEPVYHQTAKDVWDGKARSTREIFDRLRSIYVDDEAFEQNFARLDMDTSGQRRQLVKYILAKLETDASGVERAYETDPGTIEHILPENATREEWDVAFPENQWSKNVFRLGNLTLLEASVNRDLANSGYPIKAGRYAESGYAITAAIPQMAPDAWTPDLLALRQARLARRAVHIWRCDYS
ncbi:MAG: DUF262 domain-containing protein [Ramlibacter sp.]